MPPIVIDMPFAYKATVRLKRRRNSEERWMTAIRPFHLPVADAREYPVVLHQKFKSEHNSFLQIRHDGERFYKALPNDVRGTGRGLCSPQTLIDAIARRSPEAYGSPSHSRRLGYPLPSMPKNPYREHDPETDENDTFALQHRDDGLEIVEILESTFDQALVAANAAVASMVVVDGIVHVACPEPVLSCNAGQWISTSAERDKRAVLFPVTAFEDDVIVQKWGSMGIFETKIMDRAVFHANPLELNRENLLHVLEEAIGSRPISPEIPPSVRERRDLLGILVAAHDVAAGTGSDAEVYDLIEHYLEAHKDWFPLLALEDFLMAAKLYGGHVPPAMREEADEADAAAIAMLA